MSSEAVVRGTPAPQPPTPVTSQPVIQVRGLHKRYGGRAAVDGLDLEVRAGEIFALLGPNGAGKTTTVEILEGYRRRDGGDVRVLGLDPDHQRSELKPHIGVVLQSVGVEPYLTVLETLSMYAGFYPHPRPVDELLDLVDLAEQRTQRVNHLSGGQQRRLDMAVALVGDPDLLFLDEPTTGFDPAARREAWNVVKNLASLGKTVLLTTHFMDEAQFLADRVAVMTSGRVIAEGPPTTLGLRNRSTARVRCRLPAGALPPDPVGPVGSDGLVEVETEDPVTVVHALTGWAIDNHVPVDQLEVSHPSLEDVYLDLTGAAGGHGVAR